MFIVLHRLHPTTSQESPHVPHLEAVPRNRRTHSISFHSSRTSPTTPFSALYVVQVETISTLQVRQLSVKQQGNHTTSNSCAYPIPFHQKRVLHKRPVPSIQRSSDSGSVLTSADRPIKAAVPSLLSNSVSFPVHPTGRDDAIPYGKVIAHQSKFNRFSRRAS